MGSKYVDISAVMQVIGCVFNSPQLLDNSDKYSIVEDDFPNEFHKIVFGAIYKIYELGAKQITLKTISDFFLTRPKSAAVYKKNDGEKWLSSVADKADLLSFDYYYSRLKKMTLLRAYDNCGIDVTELYDPDNILDTKKKQKQEDFLDNSTLAEIAEKIDIKVSNIKMQYVDDCDFQTSQAAEGVFDLIENFKQTPEVGVPLYGPLINTVSRGARLKKFYLRSAPTGLGKAIPDETMIPTPLGWRKVKDIRVGDELFGQDGKPTRVIKVYPQLEKKEIWEVTLSDGRVAKCCKDHLWEYRAKSPYAAYETRVETIEQMYNRILEANEEYRYSKSYEFRFQIPLNKPIEYPEKYLVLDPYALGAILANKYFGINYRNSDIMLFWAMNTELPQQVANALGKDYFIHSEKNHGWTFRHQDRPDHPLALTDLFKQYPILCKCNNSTKIIPPAYLRGSIEQRWSLLEGILDTQSEMTTKGQISCNTLSPYFRDAIIELCRSLSLNVSYEVDRDARLRRYYKIYIRAPKKQVWKCFRIKTKLKIAHDYMSSRHTDRYKKTLGIVKIKPTKEKTDMTCFEVDNPDHLFLMNDFIVTHNTRSMIADCCNIGCNEIYDENFGWIKNGTSEPTLYITTEQELGEVQTMMLAFLSAVPEDHILNGDYEQGEYDRVQHAANILLKSPIYIEEMPDFSLQDIENSIKKNIREHDIKYVFHDYIHTSLKILSEIQKRSGVGLREDNILFILSNKLKDLCNTYGIFIESATQLNASYQGAKTPDQNLLRGAKSIADKIDMGSIMLPVNEEDLEALQPILEKGIFEKPVIKISIYKNRRGQYKGIYLWCKANLSICRIQPMFCTSYNYELQDIDNLKIIVEEQEGAF